MLPPPTLPMQVARQFVQQCCLHEDVPDALNLRHWRGGWWQWRTSHWVEVENRAVRACSMRSPSTPSTTEGEIAKAVGSRTAARSATCSRPSRAIMHPADEIDQPCWIDQRTTGTIVAVDNGLLDVDVAAAASRTRRCIFNQTAVPFAYDADAPEPRHWLDFLEAAVAAGARTPSTCSASGSATSFSGRLDLHKILLMVGPTRGGKGAIARVLTALVGTKNVAGPTLNSLGGDFGLAPLIGKPLAIISDARFVGRNGNIVVERLLSISGEDTLTVNRKYRDQWTGKLPSRLHVISNELPRARRRLGRDRRPHRAAAAVALVARQGGPRSGARPARRAARHPELGAWLGLSG